MPGTTEGNARNTAPGKVIEALPNALFCVELDDLSRVVAHVSARRNKDFLRLLPGDAVEVEISPLDPGRGRITRRRKDSRP